MSKTYRISINHCILLFALTFVVCVFTYFFVDRWFVDFAYQNHLSHTHFWDWVEEIPYVFVYLLPFVFAYFAIRFAGNAENKFDYFLLSAAVSFAVTFFFKAGLKYALGRYSVYDYIHKHIYGFNWFKGSQSASALPSGHMSLTTAVMVSLWLYFPKWRWVSGLVIALMAVTLACNLAHFISDIVFGFYLGSLVAYFVYYIFKARVMP